MRACEEAPAHGRSRSVQRVRPSGGALQASATTCACCLVSNLGVPPLARAVAERSGEALLDTTLADAVHGGDPDVEDRGWGRF